MSRPLVLVLAGGASNRFWPLEDKPFFAFAGQSLLERHLRMLRGLGCERFVAVVRPGAENRVRDLAGSLGLGQFGVATQEDASGMAGALLSALPALKAAGPGALYITQAQDVVEAGLHSAMLDAGDRDDAFATIAAARVRDYFPGGYLSLEGDRITSVVEKPGAGNEPSDLVNIVAHLFSSWQPLVEVLEGVLRQAQDDRRHRMPFTGSG